jgi:hypothetical protein
MLKKVIEMLVLALPRFCKVFHLVDCDARETILELFL